MPLSLIFILSAGAYTMGANNQNRVLPIFYFIDIFDGLMPRALSNSIVCGL